MKKLALLLGLFMAVSFFISYVSAQSTAPLINNLGNFAVVAGIIMGAGLILFLLDGLFGSGAALRHPKNIIGILIGALIIASMITVFFVSAPETINILTFVDPTPANGSTGVSPPFPVNISSSGILTFPCYLTTPNWDEGEPHLMTTASGNMSAYINEVGGGGLLWFNATCGSSYTETRWIETSPP